MNPHQNSNLADMEGELWRDIPEFEGLYRVSSLGRIKCLKRQSHCLRRKQRIVPERIICPAVGKAKGMGYWLLNLNKNGKAYRKLVHRLIASAWIPNPQNKPHVNHIDGNKKNNSLSNLEWVTPLENAQHAIRTGLCNSFVGEKNHKAKLSNEDVKDIRVKLREGMRPPEIKRLFYPHISTTTIQLIKQNKKWKYI